jgi:hypothetical protein
MQKETSKSNPSSKEQAPGDAQNKQSVTESMKKLGFYESERGPIGELEYRQQEMQKAAKVARQATDNLLDLVYRKHLMSGDTLCEIYNDCHGIQASILQVVKIIFPEVQGVVNDTRYWGNA